MNAAPLMKAFTSFLAAICWTACAAAEPTTTLIRRDVPYLAPASPAQSLDLYSPSSTGRHPIAVWIHGGGWAHGDKSDLQAGAADSVNRKPAAFVAKGYVFAAINYRLFPVANVRQMAGDVAQAIRWLHDHAAEFGGDPDAIFVLGHSAGSHLAALVCTDASYLNEAGLSLRAIKGCVPVDGDMFYAPLRLATESNIHEAGSDRLKFPDDGSQKEYSAVMHVAAGKGIPPFLLLHVAGHPETGTSLQAHIFSEVLRESRIPCEVLACPGKTHQTLNADLGLAGDPATAAVFAFLTLHAKDVSPPPATVTRPEPTPEPKALIPSGTPNYYPDIAYAQPKTDSRSLDIYSPRKGGHHPVVFWIHGGGWMRGDKTDLQLGATDSVNRKPQAFTDRGFVFVSINYRMLPEVTITEMMGDVAKAIAWVHRHIGAYGGDPDSIFVMGHSAGAQLAALVCTDRGYLVTEGLDIGHIKGCVPVDGDTYYPELELDIEPSIAGANAQLLDFPSLAAQQSLASVLHIFPGKPIPPFLILHVADHPETHTEMQSVILAEALRQAGIAARVVACAGRTHDTLNADLGLNGDMATAAIWQFLDDRLRPPAQ
jgi:arylformamidase